MENRSRMRINRLIRDNPGLNLNSIKKGLGMNTGALIYHMDVLIREEYIVEVSNGRFRKFYPYGHKRDREDVISMHDRILELLQL